MYLSVISSDLLIVWGLFLYSFKRQDNAFCSEDSFRTLYTSRTEGTITIEYATFYADYYFLLRALEEQQMSGVPLSAKDRSSKKNSIVMHPSRGILSTRED